MTENTKDEKTKINEVKTDFAEQKKNLTCEKDTENTTVIFCKQPVSFQTLNPFEDQTPTKILSRQYKIGEFNITPAWTGTSYNFPAALLQFDAINKALSSFYYFRSDLEVSVKINGTPYHQGLMQSSFIHDVVTAPTMTVVQKSVLNSVLYNYSSSDCVTTQYGWLHTKVFANVSEMETNHYLGTMFFDPIVPIANTSGGGTTITVTIFARFMNPRVAGFRSQPPAVQGQASMSPFKFNKKQETEDKSEAHMPVSNMADSIISPLFKTIPLVEDTVSGVIDLFAKFTKLLDKPTDISTPQRMMFDMGSDMMWGSGLSWNNRLSLYPTSKLASFGDTCVSSRNSIIALAQIPMLYDVFNFTPSVTKYELYAHPMITTSLNYDDSTPTSPVVQPDFLMLTTGMARYWRGSIKYMLYFITNSFTTARFRISYIIDYSKMIWGTEETIHHK